MIKGFEHITFELTYDEKLMVPVILKGFENHKGKQNAIKSSEIVNKMQSKGYKLTDARLRKIVNFIRSTGLAPICSNSKGYWHSIDLKEIKDEILSLNQRANAIKSASNGLIRYVDRLSKKTN